MSCVKARIRVDITSGGGMSYAAVSTRKVRVRVTRKLVVPVTIPVPDYLIAKLAGGHWVEYSDLHLHFHFLVAHTDKSPPVPPTRDPNAEGGT